MDGRFERYHVEPSNHGNGNYVLYDRLRGHGDRYNSEANRLAVIMDVGLAHRITRLLNADQAMLERQGVRG